MKKKVKKRTKSILKVLIPDHVRRTNDNSGWCKTVEPLKKVVRKGKGK